MTETIVVGAGIAGLVVARELVLLGHTVRIVESAERAGGQVAGVSPVGLPLDLGAEAFATRGGVVRSYLERLGIDDRIVTPADASAWLCTADDDLVPLPAASLLGIPSAPLAADVVRVVGRRGAWRGLLDSLLPGPVGSRLPTVGALVRRRMGDAVLERLVAPVVEGIHSKHPDRLPVSAVPELVHNLLRENSLARAVSRMRIDAPAGTLVASLDRGMVTLVDTLLRDLDRFGVRIEHGVHVVEAHADRIVIASDEDGASEVREGRIVVAAPGLVADEHGEIGAIVETHLVQLVLAATGAHRLALAGAPRGTGVLVARGSSVRARALTHVTAKWPHLRAAAAGREVVRLSYDHPVDVDQARQDASRLLGVEIATDAVEHVETVTWRRAQRFTPGAGAVVVGEQVAGTGLAAVIGHAVETARQIGPPDDARTGHANEHMKGSAA